MNGSNYSYRRRLPHWRLSSATYFVTWRLHNTQAPLSEGERRITAETIQHFDGERFTLFAFVVMDDHVHAIVEPRSGQSVDGIVHSWKSFSAHRLQKETGRAGAL
jgi:REP element-mobilizing transposase RayT